MRSIRDSAAAYIGRAVADMEREQRRERELMDARFTARMAEVDVRLAAVAEAERRLAERVAAIKDGVDGDRGDRGDPGKPGVDGRDGTSVTLDDVAPMIDAKVREVVAAIPAPKDGEQGPAGDRGLPGTDGADGKDADPAVVQRMVDEAVARLPVAKDGRDGRDGTNVTLEDVTPLLRDLVAAMPTPKDGKDGTSVTVAELEPMLREMVAAIPTPKDGERGERGEDGIAPTADEVAALIRADIESAAINSALAAIDAWERPKDGRDGADGLPGIPGERGVEGPAGKLPVVRGWTDDVTYEGDVRTHAGGTWQALRDTAKEPPHADWLCLAEPGRNGKDGRSFTIRGTYAQGVDYAMLDVVALNGASFAAKRDAPGACPGEDWQLIATQGKQGKPGDRGEPGRPGNTVTASVRSMSANDNGTITVVNADGTTVECDLYPLLSKIG